MKLSVLKRNQPIQKIDLGKDVLAFDYSETVFLIGRSKECHIVIDDKQVSREHVRIIHKNGKWFAEKTAEHNACLYNGDELTRAELDDGDSLTIGNFTINIENSVEQLFEFSNARMTPPDIKAVPEPLPIVKIPEPEIQNPIEKLDSTQEIPSPVIDVDEKVSLEDRTNSEINGLSDFESPDDPPKAEDDDFGYQESNDADIEATLGANAEDAIGDNNLSIESDENMSYSLDNIDNENTNDDNDSTQVIQSFSKVQLELFGETAPYDRYLVEGEKTFIGRDPSKCQIVLNDTEVSSVHAVIIKNNVTVSLEDLNSSNGTILNGDRINKATLNHNDEFVIGAVTFTVKFRSDFLKEENSTLMAVDENQTVEVEEFVEVQAEEGENVDALGEMISDAPQEKSFIKRIWKDEDKRKKAIYGIVVLVGAWVMFGDDSSTKTPATAKQTKKAAAKTETSTSKVTGKKISENEARALSARYEIGKNHYYNGRYREALDEFQKISAIDPNFNSSLQSLIALSKEGLSKLEDQERKRLAEQAAAEKKIKLKELIAKATEYVKDRRVDLAQEIFNEISKLDPENIEVTKMKFELEDWKAEKNRKELEIASKKKIRDDKVEKLKPIKALFIQKEWFKTIGKLDDFLKIKDMDEDLIKEASEMLKTSRDEISGSVSPLIGKAKSLMEGQDLKGAYEVYQQILKIEPSNTEALNSTGDIKEQLANKARKIYREAIISESLSLFQDAKEKFQEVQQISPVDSDYYRKATEKLKDYLE